MLVQFAHGNFTKPGHSTTDATSRFQTAARLINDTTSDTISRTLGNPWAFFHGQLKVVWAELKEWRHRLAPPF